jgi:gag-polyprotein putative aspartyl protease
MKKLRIVSPFFALASFILWGTAALSQTIVPMISDGGTFRVPVTINDELTLKFVIDSGAADVSVPADVVMTLVRTGTITDADFLGKQTYKLADGSTIPSQQFVIRSLKVGDKTLENVVGSVAPVAGGLLLGQSFLSRFNTWSIDNHRQALILGLPPNNDVGAAPDASVYKPVAPYNAPPVVLNPPPPAPGYGEPYSYPVNLNPNGDNWLALRTEPGGVRIMKMGPDMLFTVVGEQGDWAHLRLRTGETGWAAKAYIGCCKVAPSAEAQPAAAPQQRTVTRHAQVRPPSTARPPHDEYDSPGWQTATAYEKCYARQQGTGRQSACDANPNWDGK